MTHANKDENCDSLGSDHDCFQDITDVLSMSRLRGTWSLLRAEQLLNIKRTDAVWLSKLSKWHTWNFVHVFFTRNKSIIILHKNLVIRVLVES